MKTPSLSFAVLAAASVLCVSTPVFGAGAPHDLFQTVRSGDKSALRALAADGAVNTRDDLGNTPLIWAAANGDIDAFKLLLDSGADVNATNTAGANALMRAAVDEEKVRLLLNRRPGVNARSNLGNTALILAARKHGSIGVVKQLLNRGAEVNATNNFGATALMAAAAAEDDETVRLLLDRGADLNAKPNMDGDGFIWGGGRTALQWAVFRGHESMIKFLLARGAKVNDFTLIGSALTQAGWAGGADAAHLLLDSGAEVNARDLVANYTPLHWAASSERASAALVELLLARGADPNAEGGQPVDGFLGEVQTPLTLARKRGETPITQALLRKGGRSVAAREVRRGSNLFRPASGSVDTDAIGRAVTAAIPPLQKSAAESLKSFHRHASQQNCVSCHQQLIPMAAVSLAHSRGIATDQDAAKRLVEVVKKDLDLALERDAQTTFHPEPAIGDGYALLGLRFEQMPASPGTDACVQQLATIQGRDGRWFYNLPRPPIQSSDVGATALAVHALRYYPIPGRRGEFDERIQRARAWLAQVAVESNEERAYQLLGLAWAGEPSEKLQRHAEDLVREQRPDGGWAQLPKLESDAFATGQSIFALIQGGNLSASHPAVQRGLRFLLDTQLADGTWLVHRRAFPFQPPMDSGFPHGAEGWISATATSWAVMALVSALEPSQKLISPPVAPVAKATLASSSNPGEKAVNPVEFARDIKPVLERSCVSCHSGARAKGGFHLDTRPALLKGGKRGEPVVVAGQSFQSALLRYVSDQVEDLEMPPLGRREKFPALTRDEVSHLRSWIDQGANWPEGVTLLASP